MPVPTSKGEWITAILLVTGLPAGATIVGGGLFGLMGQGGTLAAGLSAMFKGAGLGFVVGLVFGIRGVICWSAQDQRFVVVCTAITVAVMVAVIVLMDYLGHW